MRGVCTTIRGSQCEEDEKISHTGSSLHLADKHPQSTTIGSACYSSHSSIQYDTTQPVHLSHTAVQQQGQRQTCSDSWAQLESDYHHRQTTCYRYGLPDLHAHLSLYDLIRISSLVKFPYLFPKGILEDSAPCVMKHGCTSQGSV